MKPTGGSRPARQAAGPSWDRLLGIAGVLGGADGWFALVTLRLGAVTRWGALALALGTLALLGIDRLGLTSAANPTAIGQIALAGVALNGIGWIVLGIDVAIRRRVPVP